MGDQLHTSAIKYLCQPDKIEKLVALYRELFVQQEASGESTIAFERFDVEPIIEQWTEGSRDGFIKPRPTGRIVRMDLCISMLETFIETNNGYIYKSVNPKKLYIEVKSKKADIMNVIAQLNLAKSYRRSGFILATLYPISSVDKELLRNQGYGHVYLDPKIVQEFANQAADVNEPHF
jgi:hypothetical protein